MNEYEQRVHLGSEELEDLAMGGTESIPPEAAFHLEACRDCRLEMEGLAALHASLSGLKAHAPSLGFADRVMARVALPVPWRARAWATVRARWLVLTAGLSVAGASTAVTVAWLGSHPEITPGRMVAFLSNRGPAIAWEATRVAAGRLLFDSGIVWSLSSIVSSLTVPDALVVLATIALMGMGAVVGLRRLLSDSPALAPARVS